MPIEVRIAIEKGYAKAFNQAVQAIYPPGTTRLEITPVAGIFYIYGLHYGVLDPGPPSTNTTIFWEQAAIQRYGDPMTHGVMDYPYPHCLKVTRENALIAWIINNSGVNQTIDWLFFIILFRDEVKYADWQTDLIELHLRLPPRLRPVWAAEVEVDPGLRVPARKY